MLKINILFTLTVNAWARPLFARCARKYAKKLICYCYSVRLSEISKCKCSDLIKS